MTTSWKIELVEGESATPMTCSIVCERGEFSFPIRFCGAPAVALFGANPVCDEHRLPGPWRPESHAPYPTYWLRCYTNANTICASVNRRGRNGDWEINALSQSGLIQSVGNAVSQDAANENARSYVDARLREALKPLPRQLVLLASRGSDTITAPTPDIMHRWLIDHYGTWKPIEAMQIGAEIERVWSTRPQDSR